MCTSGDPQAKTIACYGYPKSEFKRKPEFIAATFFVTKIQNTAEKRCLQGSQYWDARQNANARVANIDGAVFKVFEFSDAWAGGGQGGRAYRTFHDGRCYELGIQTASGNSGAYDPGTIEEWTRRDNDTVQKFLNQPLHSFKFLK